MLSTTTSAGRISLMRSASAQKLVSVRSCSWTIVLPEESRPHWTGTRNASSSAREVEIFRERQFETHVDGFQAQVLRQKGKRLRLGPPPRNPANLYCLVEPLRRAASQPSFFRARHLHRALTHRPVEFCYLRAMTLAVAVHLASLQRLLRQFRPAPNQRLSRQGFRSVVPSHHRVVAR